MKKLSIFLTLLFFVQITSGQETAVGQILKKNTFSVSYSPFSIEGMKADWENTFYTRPSIIEGEYGFAAVGYNNPKYSGIFILSYSRRLVPKFEMTLNLGYEHLWKEWKIYNNPEWITEKMERNHYLYCMLNASWIYVSRKHVDLYSSLGLGTQIAWDNVAQLDPRIESVKGTRLAYQLCLFGVRVKLNDWCGFFGNLEAGYLGIFRCGLFASW